MKIFYKTHFVLIDGTIKILLEMIHPLTAYNIHVTLKWDKRPRTNTLESGEFNIHSNTPLRNFRYLCIA